MPIIHTEHLFEEAFSREKLAGDLVRTIFPRIPPEAVQYELVQQGLLQKGKLNVSLDIWLRIDQKFQELMLEWEGPDIPVYIFPITNGFLKNGVAYREGICLFISPGLTTKELQALFAHEYHHMCRRVFMNEPPTLMDSLMMEGLAEDAVADLFGEDYLSSWTRLYSINEVRSYWHKYFMPALNTKGLHSHKPYLFGDDKLTLPPWIGYCTGYRIVQAFKEKCGPFTIKELMQLKTTDIIDGAGFKRQ